MMILSLHYLKATLLKVTLRKTVLNFFGMMVLADVECTTSTLGNLEYALIITNKYSPVGNVPQKL